MLSTGRVGHQVRRSVFIACLEIVIAWGVPATEVAAAGDATVKVKPFRLVVVFDPAKLGVSTMTLAHSAARAALTDDLTERLGRPTQVRMLLSQRSDVLAALPLEKSAASRLANSVVLDYESEVEASRAFMTLSRDPAVVRVSEGSIGQYSADPLTVIVSGMPDRYQWGLYTLNVIQSGNPAGVWAKTRGSAYVAILDNGLETAGGIHEDLAANYRAQFSKNFGAAHNGANGNPTTSDNLDEFPYPGYDYAGHGTHVTGIVAAANGNNLGGAGVCPSCSIMAGRVTTTLFGEIQPDMQILDDALFAMARRGAQVVNMSFGDPSETSLTLPDVHDALLDADERDVVVVAASGNNASPNLDFPANDTGLVFAVGGSQSDGKFWVGVTSPITFGSNWSAAIDNQQFVAPARYAISSMYNGKDWRPTSPVFCGDSLPTGLGAPGYGMCTGTSMAAPHVSGIVGLMRSVDPLRPKSQIRDILAATSNVTQCNNSEKCQLGVPDATAAVIAALGGSNVVNRKTPLFSLYSTAAQNHFYTYVPQMAMSALHAGDLLPQPANGTQIRYDGIGAALAQYTAYPTNTCGPGTCSNVPKAIALVHSTHVNPNGGADLVPLYRMSYRCGDELLTNPPNVFNPVCTPNPAHTSHFYTTDELTVRYYTGYYLNGTKDLSNPGTGYKLDGIEGFIFPTTLAQPSGAVRLCRKYDATRDDYVLFPGAGANGQDCSSTTDGYTGGNYSQLVGNTDWIGWALPASASIGPTQTNNPPTASITSPSNGAQFSAGATVTISTNAIDSDGSIARVRFYANDKLLGTDTTSPFKHDWLSVQPGIYVLRALVVDNRGAVASSSTTTITVLGTAPVFANPSFEQPVVGPGNYVSNPAGSSWLWDPVSPTGQSGISGNNSLFTGAQTAPNGVQVAFIQGEKRAEQTIQFNGATVRLKFRCTQRTTNGSTLKLRVWADGIQIGQLLTPPAPPVGSPAAYGFCLSDWFTRTAQPHQVILKGYNPDGQDNTVFVDNVTVQTQ